MLISKITLRSSNVFGQPFIFVRRGEDEFLDDAYVITSFLRVHREKFYSRLNPFFFPLLMINNNVQLLRSPRLKFVISLAKNESGTR